MEIRENNTVCIFTPLCEKLDSYDIKKLFDRIERESRKVAIDLSYVQDCTIEFVDKLKNYAGKDLGIFNIASDLFVLFNIMNLDKSVNLFVSEIDFEENSRQIINRKFSVI